jgi:biotin carboxyl carrier protein
MTDLLTSTPAPAPASPFAGSVAADLAVVVAPSAGRFQPRDDIGAWMPPRSGDLIGYVIGGRGRTDAIHCPVDARVCDLLVRPGQAVTRGQSLAWLLREDRS